VDTPHEPTTPDPDVPRPTIPGRGGHGRLTPFRPGDPIAAAGRRKGNAVVREMAALHRANLADLRELLDDLVAATPREQLGPVCAAVAINVAVGVLDGSIPVRNGSEAADVIRVLVDVARLESGQPTSTSIVGHLTSAQVRARLEELKALATDTLEVRAVPAPVVDGDDASVGHKEIDG
jgi:hypothetical protein